MAQRLWVRRAGDEPLESAGKQGNHCRGFNASAEQISVFAFERLFAGRYWKSALKKLFPFNHKKIHKMDFTNKLPSPHIKRAAWRGRVIDRTASIVATIAIYWLSQFNSKKLSVCPNYWLCPGPLSLQFERKKKVWVPKLCSPNKIY